MGKLEQHRKSWQGKSDEWLFERLANELTQKVEVIHKLLSENEQLRLYNVTQQRELLKAFQMVESKEKNNDLRKLTGKELDQFIEAFNCG